MEKNNIKKIVLWSLVILWAVVIFVFSSQPATISGALSTGITEKIINFITGFLNIDIPAFSGDAENIFISALQNLEFFVRKTAHFGIYAVLAVLVMPLALIYNNKLKKSMVITLFFCMLYAVSDEVHQLFVVGRSCKLFDIFIDTAGAFTGSLIFLGLYKLKSKRRGNLS